MGEGVAPSANYSCFDKDLTNATSFEVSTSTWSIQTRDMYDSDVGYLASCRNTLNACETKDGCVHTKERIIFFNRDFSFSAIINSHLSHVTQDFFFVMTWTSCFIFLFCEYSWHEREVLCTYC